MKLALYIMVGMVVVAVLTPMLVAASYELWRGWVGRNDGQ